MHGAAHEPGNFTSLPPSACTMGTPGTGINDYGAGRIVKNHYDANGRIFKVQTPLGTAEQADEVTTGFTANGRIALVIDAELNRTSYAYDGHDRLIKTSYPSMTKGANASSATDNEQFADNANSNVTDRRLRDGQVVISTYDSLGRMTAV